MADTPTPPAPKTAQQAKDEIMTQVNALVTSLVPDVTDSVRAQLKEQFIKLLDGNVEALKKTGKSATSSIISEGTQMIAKLKKELNEAAEEMQKKEKTAGQAVVDALTDFAKVMKADPNIISGLLLLPEVAKDFGAVIAAGKQLKDKKGEITIKYTTFITSLLGLAVTCMTLIYYIMAVFGK